MGQVVQHTPGAVSSRIRAVRPQLTTTMARIADVLLADPEAPLQLSIIELAQRAETSAATITRFCRLLGYTGYVPFRVAVAQDIGRRDANASWRTDIGEEFGPDDAPQAVLSTLLTAHVQSLEETASVLDVNLMTEVAHRIVRSRHVDVYGVGGSGRRAAELESRLYRIGINTHAWTELHDGLASAAIQGNDCVAIAISSSGRTEATIQMMETAAATGATTVAVTAQHATPLGEAADHAIIALAHERFMQPDDLSGTHAQMFVLDLLYLLVAQAAFAQSTATLAATAAAVAPYRRPVTRSAPVTPITQPS
ncbi:MAG TPA: MurR/RpiR family transcriptional regulator [Candidatus Avipropionibacterium avicola]|uniref:MurR/RpiR family transcriptional regulator n=1 Tax=Candidatus Avipropionibacterium avicola TaxID=2840701 RepID=A0A9D1H2C0_9ACTN|nr:MurR/RpiR family transcriptional regulator [Candidatus Avipropionibacterium avicola]